MWLAKSVRYWPHLSVVIGAMGVAFVAAFAPPMAGWLKITVGIFTFLALVGAAYKKD